MGRTSTTSTPLVVDASTPRSVSKEEDDDELDENGDARAESSVVTPDEKPFLSGTTASVSQDRMAIMAAVAMTELFGKEPPRRVSLVESGNDSKTFKDSKKEESKHDSTAVISKEPPNATVQDTQHMTTVSPEMKRKADSSASSPDESERSIPVPQVSNHSHKRARLEDTSPTRPYGMESRNASPVSVMTPQHSITSYPRQYVHRPTTTATAHTPQYYGSQSSTTTTTTTTTPHHRPHHYISHRPYNSYYSSPHHHVPLPPPPHHHNHALSTPQQTQPPPSHLRGSPTSSYEEVLRSSGLPKALSFRKICSKCGKTRGEHGELGFGNKCVFQDCGKCGAGIHMHSKVKSPMGILCRLTVEEGATPGAAAAYERKIRDLAARAELQKTLLEDKRERVERLAAHFVTTTAM